MSAKMFQLGLDKCMRLLKKCMTLINKRQATAISNRSTAIVQGFDHYIICKSGAVLVGLSKPCSCMHACHSQDKVGCADTLTPSVVTPFSMGKRWGHNREERLFSCFGSYLWTMTQDPVLGSMR